MNLRNVVLAVALVGLCGCVSAPMDIRASYVNPITYQQYSCDQLEASRERLSREVTAVSDQQSKARTGDVLYTTVGAILFWPALIGLAFTKDQEAELGRLKGEYEATVSAQEAKGCLRPTIEVLTQ